MNVLEWLPIILAKIGQWQDILEERKSDNLNASFSFWIPVLLFLGELICEDHELKTLANASHSQHSFGQMSTLKEV